MFSINDLINAIYNGNIRITDHADEEANNDNLTFDEIFMSILHGQIIEEYTKDKPFPSCLVFGMNMKKEPIHSVWAFNHENKWAVLITIYRPDHTKWIDWKIRRSKNDSF